jgi:enoyl-CoA hydratase/carnithine racemase
VSDLQVDQVGETATGTPSAIRARFNAPTRRNALTLSTVQHLSTLLDEEPTATILLGSTTPDIFSAGADLAVDDATRARLSDLLYSCYGQMIRRSGTVIAVVEGAAVGGGAQLAAAADIRIISTTARWRWAGPGHGLAVGAWILPALIGRSLGLELTMTSRWLDSAEAVATGFAARIDEDPWQRAYALAGQLATADPAALARIKQVASHGSLLEQLALERELNRSAWSGQAPSAHAAARDGRR